MKPADLNQAAIEFYSKRKDLMPPDVRSAFDTSTSKGKDKNENTAQPTHD